MLLSVPARKTWVQKRSVSITFILFAQEVITLCRDEGYNFDGERKQLAEGDTASIRSASDLLIALLDSLVETNICNFIEARSQTENLSLHVDNASGKISEQTILDTRRQINHLVNQFEDFFYGLASLVRRAFFPGLDIRYAALVPSARRLRKRRSSGMSSCPVLSRFPRPPRIESPGAFR